MKKEDLLKMSASLVSDEDLPIQNLRKNLYIYTSHPGITLKEISESAKIPFDTLKNLLYQNSKDCKLSTVVQLASALGITIDELIGAHTLSEDDKACLCMFRTLPERYQHFLRWAISRQYFLATSGPDEVTKTVSVMRLREAPDGTLHTSGNFRTVGISDIPANLMPQFFIVMEVCVDYYMPNYSPYDVLLIANDRAPKPIEDSVIIYGNNIFIARRSAYKNTEGEYEYYSIRDGKFRCYERDLDEIVGYIAYVKKEGT